MSELETLRSSNSQLLEYPKGGSGLEYVIGDISQTLRGKVVVIDVPITSTTALSHLLNRLHC